VPIVYVSGGSIEVDNTVAVTGSVDVDNIVDVSGTAELTR